MLRSIVVLALVVGCSKKSSEAPPQPETPEKAEPEPAEPRPAAITVKQLTGFMGFSKDGTKFAWVAPGAAGTLEYLKIIEVGKAEPTQSIVYPDEPAQKELAEKLADFTKDKVAPPADLTLAGDLTANPPTLKLVRGDKTVDVTVGQYPYPDTDGAEIWGVSTDGKHVAVHIAGKDVPGAITTGKGRDFHFFFVAPMP